MAIENHRHTGFREVVNPNLGEEQVAQLTSQMGQILQGSCNC